MSQCALAQAASKAGMDEKTARKYRRANQVPSQMRKPRQGRTRPDAFEAVCQYKLQRQSFGPELE